MLQEVSLFPSNSHPSPFSERSPLVFSGCFLRQFCPLSSEWQCLPSLLNNPKLRTNILVSSTKNSLCLSIPLQQSSYFCDEMSTNKMFTRLWFPIIVLWAVSALWISFSFWKVFLLVSLSWCPPPFPCCHCVLFLAGSNLCSWCLNISFPQLCSILLFYL